VLVHLNQFRRVNHRDRETSRIMLTQFTLNNVSWPSQHNFDIKLARGAYCSCNRFTRRVVATNGI
jgi:hypothetical protein